MLECAWSVSRHTHSMQWSACCSMHSTPRSVPNSKNALRVEWNGMLESERNSTLGTRQFVSMLLNRVAASGLCCILPTRPKLSI